MNLYQQEMYRSYLQHGERRDHKYLYKIGDRYIYPEDVKNGAKKVGQKVVNKAKETYNDRGIYGNAAKNMASDAGKRTKSLSQEVWEDRGIYADAAKNMAKDAGNKIKKAVKSVKLNDVINASNPIGRGMSTGKSLVNRAKTASENAKKKEAERTAAFNKKAAREAAESEEDLKRSLHETGADEQAANQIFKLAKKKKQKQIEDEFDLPEGWRKSDRDGYVYDDLGAIVSAKELEKYRKKTVAKK